jgi:hypothetical protein
MSPPQQYEYVPLDTVPTDEQIDIKALAAKGYYFEFPEKKVRLIDMIHDNCNNFY